MDFNILLFWLIIGYLSGSIPSGYLIGRLKGIDLTKIGSGSTGATNVLRNLGKGPAIATFLIDIFKGFLPAYLCSRFQPCAYTVMFVGVMCLIGHSKSVFLGFKGGKSSATSFGVVIAFGWQPALICFSIWVLAVYISKYSSMGSIVSIPISPIVFYLFHKPFAYILFCILATVYIIGFRHRDNIKRLLNGTEPKIGQKNPE